MKVIQIGSNRGYDTLSKFLKNNYEELELAIFVEANPLHINDLKKCYSKYKNIIIENIAIKPQSYLENKLTFYYYEDDAPFYERTSCVKSHLIKHYENFTQSKLHTFSVSTLTISELFEKYNIKSLDWLLLDVEGIDAELLLETNWGNYDIKRIEYEQLHLGEYEVEIEKIFRNLGYIKSVALHHYDDAWDKINGELKMDITLYAISKNEEKNINKFINNSKKFSHTVVVDTGSTDNTVQLLRDAGITVYEHPQTYEEFDFAKARNQALSYVETEWAFSLDFNEDIDNFHPNSLSFISKSSTSLQHLRFDDGDGGLNQSNEVHVRLHRTKNYVWRNAVHEIPHFIPTEDYEQENSIQTNVKITKKVHNTIQKQLFYLSICEREYQKDPTNWYYVWFIFNHYFIVQNLSESLEYGQILLNTTKPYFDQFRIECFIKCSQIFVNLNDFQQAANYAFHALSESMKMGEPYLSHSFSYLIDLSKILNNPNLIIFATAFNDQTKRIPERQDSIDQLFLTNLDDIPSIAWSGHRRFVEWLVNYLKPEVIVDLGTDWGFSAFSFAIPRIGKVYTIDNFIGDSFVGINQGEEKYNFVASKRTKLFLDNNLEIIRGDFSDVAKTWYQKIDILHIDGDHLYESVKNDFEMWSKFLDDDGVILMHDTCVEEYNGNTQYGVKKFFSEIDLPKINFTHTFGLGVISKNKNLINYIESNFDLSRPL